MVLLKRMLLLLLLLLLRSPPVVLLQNLHQKIETRLINERFTSVMGECVI
jgi:hypothetical protein